ncbi:cytosolic protein [Bacillaceae bacterium W0354]
MGKDRKYDDFANAEIQQNYQVPEEFPEGTYGEPVNQEALEARPVNEERRHYSAFNYENKRLHEDRPREHPGAHIPQDFPSEEGITRDERD